MKEVTHLLDLLPKDAPKIEAATLRTQAAYKRFAEGNPTAEDCQIIMVDLAFASGYYNTTHPAMPAEQVKYAEGMRAVYGRIMRFVNMPLDEIAKYQDAVLRAQNALGDLF